MSNFDLDNLEVLTEQEVALRDAENRKEAKIGLIKMIKDAVNATGVYSDASQEQRNIRANDGLNLLLNDDYYA